MQKKIKLIFFDIDGTIIPENIFVVPESTKQSLKDLKKRGHLIFINTGRTFSSIASCIQDLDFDGYVCGCGSYIEIHNTPIYSCSIDNLKCKQIVQKIREYNLHACLEGHDKIYFDTIITNDSLKKLKDSFSKENFLLGNFDDEDISFDKFVFWYNQNELFENFRNYVINDFECINRSPGFVEFIPINHSKATGIQRVLDYLGYTTNDCFAFGDSLNDLAMLNYVKTSIAMGNSVKELFNQVSFVTKNLEDNGIEFALKHFNLI